MLRQHQQTSLQLGRREGKETQDQLISVTVRMLLLDYENILIRSLLTERFSGYILPASPPFPSMHTDGLGN
jgi:hypothetical protein